MIPRPYSIKQLLNIGGAAIQGVQGSGTSTITVGTVQFSNANGITFGLTSNSVTASISATKIGGIGTVSSYGVFNAAWGTYYNNQTPTEGSTTVYPFYVPLNVHMGYVNFRAFISYKNTYATMATSANTSWTWANYFDNAFSIYSRGTGTDSDNLLYKTSAVAGITQSYNFTCNAAGSQWTVSEYYTFYNKTGTSTISQVNPFSSTKIRVYEYYNLLLSIFLGDKMINMPLAYTLTPGNYWAAFKISTYYSGSVNTIFSEQALIARQIVIYDSDVISQCKVNITATSVGPLYIGMGLFSSSTTASKIALPQISYTGYTTGGADFHEFFYFQFSKDSWG